MYSKVEYGKVGVKLQKMYILMYLLRHIALKHILHNFVILNTFVASGSDPRPSKLRIRKKGPQEEIRIFSLTFHDIF